MIEARRKISFSLRTLGNMLATRQDYVVFENDPRVSICTLELSWFRNAGDFTLAGEEFQIRSESMWSSAHILSCSGSEICRAVGGRGSYSIAFEGHEYVLKFASRFGWAFYGDVDLQDDGETVGYIRMGAFRDPTECELPDVLPQHLKVFMLWLAFYNNDVNWA